MNCPSGKVTYYTLYEAHETARILRDRRHRRVEPYYCNECGYYHHRRATRRRITLRTVRVAA